MESGDALLSSEQPNVGFARPGGIVNACVDNLSGKAPGPYTGGNKRCDLFIAGTVPTAQDDWRIKLDICTVDGKLASEACKKVGKSVEKFFFKIRAEKPEWQDDVNAWVARAYAGQGRYFPPTKTSPACFDNGGKVVSCTGSAAAPLLSLGDVSFYDWSGNSLTDLNRLPDKFEVRVKPVTQPGTSIAFVRFSLHGSGDPLTDDCATNLNECNTGSTPGWDTNGAPGYYSSKDNEPLNKNFRLFDLSHQDDPVSGDYRVRIEVQDKAGGLRTLEISVTVVLP